MVDRAGRLRVGATGGDVTSVQVREGGEARFPVYGGRGEEVGEGRVGGGEGGDIALVEAVDEPWSGFVG